MCLNILKYQFLIKDDFESTYTIVKLYSYVYHIYLYKFLKLELKAFINLKSWNFLKPLKELFGKTSLMSWSKRSESDKVSLERVFNLNACITISSSCISLLPCIVYENYYQITD